MAVNLASYQLKAMNQMKNGSILCGGVGSGKSRTGIGYYIFVDCCGDFPLIDEDDVIGPFLHERWEKMKHPKDLYIITTAKKRDSLEWEKECAAFGLGNEPSANVYGVKVTIDSWNNIKKYKNVNSAFFIFDEQRVVGRGAWVKTFLNLARKNHWILLSATPGDTWSDYIPVFVANGFYKNRTEFQSKHCVFSRFSKYPKIERYIGERELLKRRNEILVPMEDQRTTERHNIYLKVKHDKDLFRNIYVDRWNPFDNEPIQESGKWVYLMRRAANTSEDRVLKVGEILEERRKAIIFYNFNYELDLLREKLQGMEWPFAEYNGKIHEEVPNGERWAYLVQYSAGCEGWNCITCDTTIFYSQNYSYRILEQASGRIDRINTPYKDLYYYHLRSSAFIDSAIYQKLKNKKRFNERSLKERW